MIRLIVVPGTWGREQTWYRPAAALGRVLAGHDVQVYEPSGRPFLWSTDAGGWQMWRRWGWGARDRDHWDWMAGGEALYDRIVPALAPERRIPPAETVVLSHSHGLQVVLYAAAAGLRIDRLIDVAGPVRADLRAVTAQARPHIRQWLHVHSDRSDRMQWLGELGDGALGVVRAHPRADLNWALPQAGHSAVLHEPDRYADWWGHVVDWQRRA